MSGWPTVALGDVFEIARGGSPRPIDSYITDDPAGINWITITDASDGSKYITATKRRIKPEGLKRSRAVQVGDFLLTNSMSFGRPYIMGTSGCIHDGWLVLSPRRADVDREFFYYLLGSNAVYSEFERRASGVTVKNLNIELVKGVSVPLPPLSEQRRIAEILEKADALRAKRRAALAQLETLTNAVFIEMFGDPDTNSKQWPTAPLASLCTIAGEYGASVASRPFDPQLPRYVRITDVTESGELGVDAVSPAGDARSWRSYALAAGDLLFARSGATVGKTYLHRPTAGPCVFAGYLIRFRPRPNVATPDFLFGYTRTRAYRSWVTARQRVVAQPNINAQQYGYELLVPCPPVWLQQEFDLRCKGVRRMSEGHRKALAELDALFASLQHRAFRGEL